MKCNNIDKLLSFSRSSLIGTNRNDDAHNIKVTLKSDSIVHLNDEVFAHENGHSNERVESNHSVSLFFLVIQENKCHSEW